MEIIVFCFVFSSIELHLASRQVGRVKDRNNNTETAILILPTGKQFKKNDGPKNQHMEIILDSEQILKMNKFMNLY